jgi:Zn-dependent M28 family amino/carboxypeptidase
MMLNFDMVGVGTEWLLIGTGALQEQGKVIASEMGIPTRSTALLGASSDHASFIEAGIPALMLHRSNDPLLHTPEDVLARISADQLEEAVRLGLAFLAGVSPA